MFIKIIFGFRSAWYWISYIHGIVGFRNLWAQLVNSLSILDLVKLRESYNFQFI